MVRNMFIYVHMRIGTKVYLYNWYLNLKPLAIVN